MQGQHKLEEHEVLALLWYADAHREREMKAQALRRGENIPSGGTGVRWPLGGLPPIDLVDQRLPSAIVEFLEELLSFAGDPRSARPAGYIKIVAQSVLEARAAIILERKHKLGWRRRIAEAGQHFKVRI